MKKNYIISFIILFMIVYLYFNYDNIKIWIINRIIVLRGILAPSCFWYKISDLILYDGSGIDLYNKYKNKYGDFALTHMFNEKIYLVTNNKYIQTILENSPNIFGAGNLKIKFFRSFMEKNVGVSNGCPWRKRRHINEYALDTDMLHRYSSKYSQDMEKALIKWNNKNTLVYSDFLQFGKFMASQIVFNAKNINPDIFNIFKEANTLTAFEKNYKINEKIHNNYTRILNHYINNPINYSLVKLLTEISHNNEEIRHQIPHFIFPIVGLFVTTIPRVLVLLFNHPNVLKKLIKEINQVDIVNSRTIYKLTYLRKCILETLRLNNPVITTFRTLLQDFSFNKKYHFKKGTQFLILNNPVLREKEFFDKPNKFIPSRWTDEMEKSFYAISFNQGPQGCPGKELAIFLAQSFVYNFIKVRKITSNTKVKTISIDTSHIPQIINPCSIVISF